MMVQKYGFLNGAAPLDKENSIHGPTPTFGIKSLAALAKPFIKCYMHERTKNATHYGTNATRIYQITTPQISLRLSKYDTIKSIRKQQLMAVRSVGQLGTYSILFEIQTAN